MVSDCRYSVDAKTLLHRKARSQMYDVWTRPILADRFGVNWFTQASATRMLGLGLRVDASRKRRDRCHQLAGIDRLGEMHLKPAPQRPRAIFRSRERRQRGGGNAANGRILRFPETRDQLEAVHLRHAEIDDEHLRLHLRDPLKRGQRRAERRHLGARGLEHDAQH